MLERPQGGMRWEVVGFSDELWKKWKVVEENTCAAGKLIHAQTVE